MSVSPSDARFAGSVPTLYDEHLAPVCLAPFAGDLAARVPGASGTRLLETACGTGVATRRLLERLPADGRITATDLNEDMLAVFRAKVPADARLVWRQADAQDLPFADGAFDAVACQFGVMFYPDKPRGLREARRVLRSGGRFVFNTWLPLEANPVQRVARDVIEGYFEDDPPLFYRTPFSWSDAGEVRETLLQAGFVEARVTPVEAEGTCVSHRSLAIGFVRGNPILHAIEERRVDPDVVVSAVEARLRELWPGAPFRVPMRALVAEAVA